MSKPKKHSITKKTKLVQEPPIEYKSEFVLEDEISQLLEKLIKKGIEQCEKGETTQHEVVMARIKQKFNLPL
jgi:predicted transcriptional regulator